LPPASSLAAAEGLKPERLAMLAQLQARFAAGLPERWTAIRAAAADPAEQAMLLHRLAGAAGSFGLGDVSEAARSAERLANPVADGLEPALQALECLIQSKLGPA
jgi:HPt (histidine-containing phosphotransfer) domain-containing protein